MRAVIYVRVSTKEQVEQGSRPDGFSLAAQLAACRRRAIELRAEVVGEFTERGVSGRSLNRPELQALLTRIETKGVDLLIVHKLDRLARNLSDSVMLWSLLRSAGVQLVSVSEHLDDTPSGRLSYAVMAGFNEFYSANLALEALKGATEKARQGGTPHRAPVGYRNRIRYEGSRENRYVELDPVRAPLIAWAFEVYATGDWSMEALARELEKRGLQSRRQGQYRRPVHSSLLSKVFANRYYLGRVTYRGVEYQGAHLPLVSPEIFEACQRVRYARRHARRTKHDHELKPVLRCARCGNGLMCGTTKGGQFKYFFCKTRHRLHTCDLPYLPTKLVEQAVSEHRSQTPRPISDVLLVDDVGSGERQSYGKAHLVRITTPANRSASVSAPRVIPSSLDTDRRDAPAL